MRVGFVYHKDPRRPPVSIDLVRLQALTEGLRQRGLEVEILAPVAASSQTAGGVPVHPVSRLRSSGFVSLTLTPMLCSRFLRPGASREHGRLYLFLEGFFDGMLRVYDWSLQKILRRRRVPPTPRSGRGGRPGLLPVAHPLYHAGVLYVYGGGPGKNGSAWAV